MRQLGPPSADLTPSQLIQHSQADSPSQCSSRIQMHAQNINSRTLGKLPRPGTGIRLFRQFGLTVQKPPERSINCPQKIFVLANRHHPSASARDIKLDNILVNEDQENQGLKITIADFGFALQLQEGQLTSSFKGTKRGYMAPEIHQVKTSPKKQYCPKATDVFALGVVLYALVMGRLPFEYATPEDRHYKFIAKEDQESFWNMQTLSLQKLKVSSDSLVDQFKDLFMKMVTCNPKERLKIQEVLQHPWMFGRKKQPEL